ncbi:phosphoribosylglycinamide formyltransferase 2, partial [Escherichia coli]|nr:phosphoribosylglycinamide formyltransferase 2 [Escherichia coli]
ENVTFDNVQNAVGAGLQIRLFGKPEIDGSRRLGVALATAESVDEAIERAKHAAAQIKVQA